MLTNIETPTPEEAAAIAAEIRELRAKMEISLQEFANQVGATKRTVVYWESGKHTPGRLAMRRLARLREVVEQGLDMRDREEPPRWKDPGKPRRYKRGLKRRSSFQEVMVVNE